MNKFLQTVALIGLSVMAFLFQLYVLIKLWGFTMVSQGLPALDFNHALVFSLMITLFVERSASPPDTGDAMAFAVGKVLGSFIKSAVALALGYWILG